MQLYVDDCDNRLTKEEVTARDIMINSFNPVLKFLLAKSKPQEWESYGYNSCRQTAIFGAIYLKELLSDYDVVPYEGEFAEIMNNKIHQYTHCFIIASKEDRKLIVDLSRTTKHLLFNVVTNNEYFYPLDGDYSKVRYLYSNIIDLNENYYSCDFNEYFTDMKPMKTMDLIKCMIDSLTPASMMYLKDSMYSLFTCINKGGDAR